MTCPGFFQGTEMPDAGWWEALWPEPGRVLEQVDMRAGMTVIDLCSGDGWFTLQIARLARKVFAVDIDRKLLEIARTRLAENGIANCRFIEGDAFDIAKLVPEAVDFVLLANAFHGVPDRPRLARAVHESLAPSGLFAIVGWHAGPREETTILGAPRGPATELRMTPAETAEAVEPGEAGRRLALPLWGGVPAPLIGTLAAISSGKASLSRVTSIDRPWHAPFCRPSRSTSC
jgi:SAM-dependent methyltransferase